MATGFELDNESDTIFEPCCLAKSHRKSFYLSDSHASRAGELIHSDACDVPVPTINTLHGMPSPSHLSSTQSELGNCNVHYSGFDTDLSTPASVDDQINTNDYSVIPATATSSLRAPGALPLTCIFNQTFPI